MNWPLGSQPEHRIEQVLAYSFGLTEKLAGSANWRTLVRTRRYHGSMQVAVQTSLAWDEPIQERQDRSVSMAKSPDRDASDSKVGKHDTLGKPGNAEKIGNVDNANDTNDATDANDANDAGSGNLGATRFASLDNLERIHLLNGAWVELRRGWLRGGFELLDGLVASSEWVNERRRMYDREVDTPRLLRFYRTGELVPWEQLVEAREILSAQYRSEFGEDFTSTGMCLYRDGRDSVAWHGDTIGRGATEDTIVAIVSLGASRTFALRPRGGGSPSMRFTLNHGDLIVMGGSCQRTWEHALPKTAKTVGARISVQFRPTGVS